MGYPEALWCTPKMIAAIKCLYDDSVSKVKISKNLSRTFLVKSGVLQGDTLAPFLFIVVLDYVLKSTTLDNFGISACQNSGSIIQKNLFKLTPVKLTVHISWKVFLFPNPYVLHNDKSS